MEADSLPTPDTKRRTLRWFHPTPGRSLIVLLVVEGLLLLSERFRWFPFNDHKGWTVLIAVASAGAAFLAMILCCAIALVFRWPFQFSLRSLLALVVAVAPHTRPIKFLMPYLRVVTWKRCCGPGGRDSLPRSEKKPGRTTPRAHRKPRSAWKACRLPG